MFNNCGYGKSLALCQGAIFFGGAILLSVVSHFFTEGAFLPVVAPFGLALG